jgi:RNA-directed DNA polymerase
MLHPEKTRVVHSDDGFNFLGFSIRRYKGKCLIKPQKEKVLSFLRKLQMWLNAHKQAKAEQVIRHLSPILIGWSNNYKHVVSKQVFQYVLYRVFKMVWMWCLRRHSNKGKRWVRKKYFAPHHNVTWTFQARSGTETLHLFDVATVRIERFVKVRGSASPDDPTLQDYWRKRREKRSPRSKVTRKAMPPPAGSDTRAG